MLYRDVEALRARGLIQGGSLQNAVVVQDDGILNEEPLRFPDEFVRHKILDLLGDLTLLGPPGARARPRGALRARAQRALRAPARAGARRRRPSCEPLLGSGPLRHHDIERIMPHRYPMLLVDRILYLRGARAGGGASRT